MNGPLQSRFHLWLHGQRAHAIEQFFTAFLLQKKRQLRPGKPRHQTRDIALPIACRGMTGKPQRPLDERVHGLFHHLQRHAQCPRIPQLRRCHHHLQPHLWRVITSPLG